MLQQVWSGLASALIWMGLLSSSAPPTVEGYVEGEFVFVSPTVGGVVQSLSVQRGTHVVHGAPLFALDSVEEKAACDQASAELAGARDRLANLLKGRRIPEIQTVAAQKTQAEAQLRLAKLQLDRQQRLVQSGTISREQFDLAKATYDQQTAHVDELQAQVALARLTLGREDELRAAENDIAAKEATLAQVKWRLDQKTVVAPATGLVADTFYRPGEMVIAGQPVVSILPPDNLKARVFVPEALLARLPIGAAVTLACTGCGPPIESRVRFVSPQAEFTPPVLYNRENRNRLVFMVEAWPTTRAETLRPGQPVDMTVP